MELRMMKKFGAKKCHKGTKVHRIYGLNLKAQFILLVLPRLAAQKKNCTPCLLLAI